MIDNRMVGKTIAMLRQNRGMTQQQLAAALNVSHQAVSKWENGAALPDIQTLMALTNFFGITVEQLLNGEVPSDRMSSKPLNLDEQLQNIGNFVGNIVDGIFHPKKKEAQVECEDEAVECDFEVAQDVPAEDNEDHFDLQKLLQMAPFMSKEAVDALLLEHTEGLTAADIARFAPYISRECLEKLIQNPETEITWETLQRIAPFLKREMVDKLAKAAAKGEQFVKKAAGHSERATEEWGKAFGDMSQKIGAGVEKTVRKAAKISEKVATEVTNAFNDLFDSAKSRDARAAALRQAAFERAMQDGRWDWIAAHLDEIKDEALLRKIAQKANALGMHDWVLEHMDGYADTRTIEAAIEVGNWTWLGEHVWQFEDDLQEKIALAAAQAENWQWLYTYAGQISLSDCGDKIAIAAYQAGSQELALQLARRCLSSTQRENLANAAADDAEFLEQMSDILDAAYFGRLCLAAAQASDWQRVEKFVKFADNKDAAQMMELAIAEGNFEAIDLLNPYL